MECSFSIVTSFVVVVVIIITGFPQTRSLALDLKRINCLDFSHASLKSQGIAMSVLWLVHHFYGERYISSYWMVIHWLYHIAWLSGLNLNFLQCFGNNWWDSHEPLLHCICMAVQMLHTKPWSNSRRCSVLTPLLRPVRGIKPMRLNPHSFKWSSLGISTGCKKKSHWM